MGMETDLTEALRESSDAIEARIGSFAPEIGIVLGSGLGPLAEEIEDAAVIPFGDIPYMMTSTASNHAGRFVFGRLSGRNVMCMQGRLHGYEGYTSQQVAYPIWLMSRLGAHTVITTNAAGAINESYHVGDFCIMKDHINLTGRNPIVGQSPNDLAFRFFSMLDAYDPKLRDIAKGAASSLGIPVHEGVYLGLLGPSFETPAEIRAFRALGADTVAMSVCEEVIAARHVGMSVLGISLCSNMACGVEGADPTDEEVFQVAKQRQSDFCCLIREILERI